MKSASSAALALLGGAVIGFLVVERAKRGAPSISSLYRGAVDTTARVIEENVTTPLVEGVIAESEAVRRENNRRTIERGGIRRAGDPPPVPYPPEPWWYRWFIRT